MDSNVEELAKNFKEGVIETAEEILGRQRKRKQPWVTNDILDLCDTRRNLKGKRYTDPGAAEQYRTTNRLIRKKMTAAKEEWINQQCETIEEGMQFGNSKMAYSTLKTLTRPQSNKTTVLEDKDGNLLTENTAVLKQMDRVLPAAIQH